MKLRNLEIAVIPPEKLRDYLLSVSHPIGRFKSVFFRSLGYEVNDYEVLEKDIRSLLVGDAEKSRVWNQVLDPWLVKRPKWTERRSGDGMNYTGR